MTSAEIQALIVQTMRKQARGLDYFQIAAAIGQAPFRVRAELKALKRERIVRDELVPPHIHWQLTAHGYLRAYEADQLAMT